MIRAFLLITITIAGIYFYSCSDPTSGNVENLPPDTYLSIFPDSTIAPGSTLKRINWWGDDPDGLIRGFFISFDSVNWGYTTKNDSTFLLSINGNDSTFRFFVAAIDDKGLVDPTPATNLYPVLNTPPSVTFNQGTELPDTTFPIASFKWTGTDPDGNQTIRYYQYSLNDTLNFRRISGTTNLLTLTQDSGLVINSENIFYLRAEDNAGALSPIIRMPDTSATWYVRPNTSKILMVRDLLTNDIATATPYFDNAFDTIHYDIFDIKSNNGSLIPNIINPMFIETLKLYDIVFWTGGNNSVSSAANFDLARQSLPFYIQSGGKVFFASGFQGVNTQIEPGYINFAPIDSVTSCSIPFVSTNLINSDMSYPVIGSSSFVLGLKGLMVSTATVVYKLYSNSGCFDTINVGIKDLPPPSSPKVIYFAIPIYSYNNDPLASKELFRKIFIDEFGY
ncbi:MAG: hypothetical protein R3A12_11335 [Ignavibacteria bacterium]